MILTSKKWHSDLELRSADVDTLLDKIVEARGIDTDEKKKDFFSDNPTVWHDPFLFKDMDKAVEIIVESIAKRERILIYGDYDADGVTATTILVRYLRSHGCDVDYLVPHRAEHGYGLTDYIINDVLAKKPGLLITVDCGISNFETIKVARDSGIKVIVTDHHMVQEHVPDADAVICAKRPDNEYPCPDLCGAGVAMKLVEAMGRDGRYKVFPNVWRQVIELSGIATIADLVPVRDENRTLVKKCFQSMANPANLGVKVMNQMLLDNDKKPDETYISFVFVPRINAAGRLYDSSDSLKLFMEDDPVLVKEAANALTRQNDERKEIEAKVFQAAKEQVENVNRPVKWQLTNIRGPIVAYGKDWHQGVLGIVAGKVAQHFGRSAIIFTEDGLDTDSVKGSARSFGEFDIYNAISHISDDCVNFGGHKKAAGLVVKKDKLPDFMNDIEKYTVELLNKQQEEGIEVEQQEDVLDVDAFISSDMINMNSYEKLLKMAPHGLGNAKPVFATRNLKIYNVTSMSQGAHLRLDLYDHVNDPTMNNLISAVGFGMGMFTNMLKVGDVVDIAYTMNLYTYYGNESLSLHLSDIKPVFADGILWNKPDSLEKLYASGLPLNQMVKLIKDDSRKVDVNLDLIPSKEQFAGVYKTISNFCNSGFSIMDAVLLARMTEVYTSTRITPFQVLRCLEVFDEAQMITLGRVTSTRACFCLRDNGQKCRLSETNAYKKLVQ